MKKWMIENNIATSEELEEIESTSKKEVLEGKKEAWTNYLSAIKEDQAATVAILNQVAQNSENKVFIEKYANDIAAIKEPIRKDLLVVARKVLRMLIWRK